MLSKYLIMALFLSSYCYGSLLPEEVKVRVVGTEDLISNLVKSFSDKSIAKNVGQGANDILNSLLSAVTTTLEGKEFEKFARTTGSALGKGARYAVEGGSQDMKNAAALSGETLADSANEFWSEAGRAVDKNSQFTKTIKKGLGSFSGSINTDLINPLIHENMIKWGLISLSFSAAGLGLTLAFKMLEKEWSTPKLIIESSKKSYMQQLKALYTPSEQPVQMVFSPKLKHQLDGLVKVTSVINKKIKEGNTNVKYRNLMLYGPPGTGKTMFAKKLAKESGLEYAFMSGSSFSKFKEGDGIQALDELFAWAQKANGLMIFIDEAETFLSKRENMDPQSKAYQLLNNFLNYTGERSNKFMLVFATNHQESLDSAMYRRIDDLVEMPLPSKLQRMDALRLYKNKILMDVQQNGKQFVDSVKAVLNNQKMDAIAEQTKGLSYGDIEGIINIIKTDSDMFDPAIISDDLVDTIVERAIKKHNTFTGGKLLGTVED